MSWIYSNEIWIGMMVKANNELKACNEMATKQTTMTGKYRKAFLR
jgi:hypothetical protein